MQELVKLPLAPLCLFAGGLCLFLAFINTHGVDKNGFAVTLLLGCGSVVGAVLFVVRAWRYRNSVERGDTVGAAPVVVLVGASMAVYGLLLTYGVRATEEADGRKLVLINRVKMVASALLTYEADKGRLPPAAVFGKDGRPLLSWRVLILPYLDDPSARSLFAEFKHDEPWDSPHNARLLKRMPRDYAPPEGSTPEPFGTYFQVFVGKGTAFERPEGTKFADFPHRGAKTFLLVEAGEAVPWTKPQDLTYATDESLPRLGHVLLGQFAAAFVDGHVERLSTDLSESDLRALITRNGG